LGKQLLNLFSTASLPVCTQGLRPFTINADDLLLPGNNSGLDDRLKGGVTLEAIQTDPRFAQKFCQFFSMRVFANETHDEDRWSKFPDVPGNICGATGVVRFPNYFDDGYWRLRRDPRDTTPNEFVEHEVADHQDALARYLAEQFFDSFELHSVSSDMRKLRLLKEKTPLTLAPPLLSGIATGYRGENRRLIKPALMRSAFK
jgi:hypothetical protein